MAARLGEFRYLGSDPAICKLVHLTTYRSVRDDTTHSRNMKETSFFCIYLGIVYEKGDVFLRRKIGILGLIVLLLCVGVCLPAYWHAPKNSAPKRR